MKISLVVTWLLAIPAVAVAAPAHVESAAIIKIPGGEHGIGFDDIGYSPALGRVTVPAGGTGNLALIHPVTGSVTLIRGVSTPAAPGGTHREGTTSAVFGAGYLFASDHDPAQIVTIDPHTDAIIGRTALAGDSDYVRYVARTHEIWATEPDLHQIEVFRLSTETQPTLTPTATIKIPGGPESLEIDNARDHAYSNLWTNKTLELSLTGHAVLAEWPNTCKHSHGIALDMTDNYVFVACAGGKIVTLSPAAHGRILATAKAGSGVDIISYSPNLHHLYVPGAQAATLEIFDVSAAGTLTPIATYRTAPRAHCVANDNAGHVFVCDPIHGTILEINDQ